LEVCPKNGKKKDNSGELKLALTKRQQYGAKFSTTILNSDAGFVQKLIKAVTFFTLAR